MNFPLWTLDEARALIAQLQTKSRHYGYHLCLGGGVLNTGVSAKDLDLYFLPLDDDIEPQPIALLDWMQEELGDSESIPFGSDGKGNPGTSHYAWKHKFNHGGKRIDVFVTP